MVDNKVTNIKYKQLDKDPEFKESINNIERLVMGEKAVGLFEHLGLTPGKVQKHLDEMFDQQVEELIVKNKDYIFKERMERGLKRMEAFLEDPTTDKTRYPEYFAQVTREVELEIIKELIKEEEI